MRMRSIRCLLTVLAASVVLSAAVAFAGDAPADEKALFRRGAEMWPEYCGNCHKARPGGERSAAEWDTIMLHMRVVANLPADNARAIEAFLRAH
jgi:mono/diheme cytochrome c family protein